MRFIGFVTTLLTSVKRDIDISYYYKDNFILNTKLYCFRDRNIATWRALAHQKDEHLQRHQAKPPIE